ncbi:hypothetical protein [Cyclobacterium plantarum]|uniref:Lipoprotein n=1 Tax=Cyclobacterium plantarum TaxID=2716263 RepID=A0ABX0H895_9BACT|nr:hypothetical protein [Cyclobacterium plantarum]NHE56422.1 hypothetical protein [Cyclobacterium plantarum]
MIRKKYGIIYSIFLLTNIFISCATKITFIGTLTDTEFEKIPIIFKISKPDGAFQIVQLDENSYMWLATNGMIPDEIKYGNFFTNENIQELTGRIEQPKKEVEYYEQDNYRVVQLISSGTPWDYLYLYEEFKKIKNANTLKFSASKESNKIVYLFSYKK